jgi:hypothetical protein
MRKYKEYNKKYHNNPLNWLLSTYSINEMSIMDLDAHMYSWKSKNQFIIDHKNINDNLSLNTCRVLNHFASAQYSNIEETNAYVVKGLIDTKNSKNYNALTIYEIKNTKIISKDINDFIEDEFVLPKVEDFVSFFDINKKKFLRNKHKYRNEKQTKIQF